MAIVRRCARSRKDFGSGVERRGCRSRYATIPGEFIFMMPLIFMGLGLGMLFLVMANKNGRTRLDAPIDLGNALPAGDWGLGHVQRMRLQTSAEGRLLPAQGDKGDLWILATFEPPEGGRFPGRAPGKLIVALLDQDPRVFVNFFDAPSGRTEFRVSTEPGGNLARLRRMWSLA